MASLTTVLDTVGLKVAQKGETVSVAISGTYNMTLKLQREVGSLGSGSWETLQTWDTANATVAYLHTTDHFNENLRVLVAVDTSGTAVVTLEDTSDLDEHVIKDLAGNRLAVFSQKGLELFGNLTRNGTSGVVNTTAALALNAEDHAGKVVTVDAATGVAITLPEAVGKGDVYTVFVGTTISSGAMTVVAPSSATSFIGGVGLATDIGGVTILANAGDDTVTMSGSTTGGVKGSWLRFTDVADGIFMLEGFLCSTGSEADPFSAGV